MSFLWENPVPLMGGVIARAQVRHRFAAHTGAMSDDVDPAAPPSPEPAPEPTSTGPTAPARVPWRDRVLGWRGVLAVALASLILGGLGGAALTVLVDDDEARDGWRHGPGHPGDWDQDGRMPGPGGPMMGDQNGVPNQ